MKQACTLTHIVGVIALGVALTALALLLGAPAGAQLPVAAAAPASSPAAAPGDTYCVAVISATYPGCNRVFTNIQAAVDAATGLETIKVAQGTYSALNTRSIPAGYFGLGGPITQVLYITKTVFIQGGYTTTNWTTPDPVAHPTTLNAQAQGRVVLIAGNITPTLTGLRLTGGNATNLGGIQNTLAPPPDAYDAGGGVFILSATATVSNSWLTNNIANTDLILLPPSFGGGAYLDHSPSLLDGNTVATNTARYGGGGIYLFASDATVSHNSIYGNSINGPGDGGGLSLESSTVAIDHNIIMTNSTSGGNGGGVAVFGGSTALADSVIIGNTALNPSAVGGGLYLNSATATLHNNIIAGNQVGGLGAGLYVALASTVDLAHNTLAQNTGGDGSGVYLESFGPVVSLSNSILVSHTIGLFADDNSIANLDSTLFGNETDTVGSGTITDTNPLSGDPGFVNPDARNYHITSSSAAIDQGFNAGVTTDIDGDARPLGLGFDLGADEFYNPAANVTKSASASSALPGAVITYTIRLTNTGNVTLTTYISDTLSPRVTFKGPITIDPAGGSIDTPPAIAGGQSIGFGKSITVTFPVTVNTGTGMTAGSIITNSAAITTSPTTLAAQPIVATVNVTVLNAPPIAANDTYTTPINTAINMSVRDNDTDPNGDALTVTAIGTPSNGTASISSGGASVIYTPTTGFVGTNVLTYTVRDPGGLPGTASITINVVNIPISGLAAQNSSPTAFGQPTFFTATIAAGTNVDYAWSFGDGGTAVGPTASHTYSAVGNYTAIVTTTNTVPSSASATTAVTITKATPAVAIISDVPDPSVVGQSVAITFTVTPSGAGTPTGVVTVTDGAQLCAATLPATSCGIAFTSAGAKSLTAQYSGDANFTGATSASAAHAVNKAGTTTSISSIVPTPALFGQPVVITASLSVNTPGVGTPPGVITITDGAVTCIAALPARTCSLTFNVLGSHTITATYSGDANFNGSSGTSPLTVNDVPINGLAAQNSGPTRLDDATFLTATIATGTNVIYVWNFGDGGPTTNGASVSHTYAASGTYTALVTATNSANNLPASTVVTITNQPPVAVASNNAVSPGALVTLNGSDSFDPDQHLPLTYSWTQIGGPAMSFTPNLSVTTFTAPGSATVLTFTLTVSDVHNLPSPPTTVTIVVDDLPMTNLTASSSSPTVLGTDTFFTATQTGGTGVTYIWNFGDGNTGSGENPLHMYAAVGAYTATVTATNIINQLVATTQVVVGVPISGLAANHGSPAYAGGSTVFTATISAGTNVTYQWNFGDGGTSSGANSAHVYSTPGSYTALVTATNVFGSQVATTTVAVLAQAGLSLVTSAAPNPVSIGRPLVYTLIVHNSGPTNSDNVVLTDTLPGGVTFGSATTTQGTCGTPAVTCNLGTVINSGSVTVTIVVTPSLLITSPVIIVNSAGVSSTTVDLDLADNTAALATTIDPRRIFLPLVRR